MSEKIEYKDLNHSAADVDQAIEDIKTHKTDTTKHITAAERTAWNNKVDSVSGKQLSTEDYTTSEKQKLAGLSNYDDTEVKADISALQTGKVNTEEGKGLSSNDFTDSEKAQISANSASIAAVANDSSKNRLKVTRSGATVNGVTFTVNSDGTVTANGTATDLTRFDVSTEMRVEIGKTYILSGCPKLSGILVQYSDKTSYAKNDTGEGVDFNAVSTGTPTIIIRVNPNAVLNNVTFKPMICTPEEWAVSQEFVPYAPTNRELYEMILSLQSGT